MSYASLRVRLDSALAEQLHELLGQSQLDVIFLPGGLLRVAAAPRDPDAREGAARTRDRSSEFAIAGDDVGHANSPSVAKHRPLSCALPVEHCSYAGSRFLSAGTLPEGAEVVAIRADGADFRVRHTLYAHCGGETSECSPFPDRYGARKNGQQANEPFLRRLPQACDSQGRECLPCACAPGLPTMGRSPRLPTAEASPRPDIPIPAPAWPQRGHSSAVGSEVVT